jgi:hypothetical protein
MSNANVAFDSINMLYREAAIKYIPISGRADDPLGRMNLCLCVSWRWLTNKKSKGPDDRRKNFKMKR